jgi:murein hydrolase activator
MPWRKPLFTFLVVLATAGVASAQGEVPAPAPGMGLASPAAIAEMDRRIAEIDRDSLAAKKELEGVGPARNAASLRIRARGRILYKMIRAGLMPLSGGFETFVEHAQQVERLKRALDRDLESESRLGARGVQLATSLEAWAKERAELADRRGLAEAAKVAIDEDRRRREAFERAFATSLGPTAKAPGPDEIVVYGPSGKTPLESIEPGSFKARKGRLSFPVAGQADVRPVFREGGPGVEILAPLGTIVRAVHAGRVAFADRYGTYGSLVILDHGERCYTVSANLGTTDVKVGDEVSAGEKIGTVGDDGRGASLYFEVRIGNEKVAPKEWLGL